MEMMITIIRTKYIVMYFRKTIIIKHHVCAEQLSIISVVLGLLHATVNIIGYYNAISVTVGISFNFFVATCQHL